MANFIFYVVMSLTLLIVAFFNKTSQKKNKIKQIVFNSFLFFFMSAISVIFGMAKFRTFYSTNPFEFELINSIPNYILCFIVIDFFHYIQHRLDHSIELLWKLHRVHHQGTEFDSSLSFRWSPYSIFYYRNYTLVILFLGFSVQTIAVVFFAHQTFMFFHHFDKFQNKFFGRFLVLSDFHRRHHNTKIEHQNTNFGGVLTVWDHLFKTYNDKDTNIYGILEGSDKDEFSLLFVFFGQRLSQYISSSKTNFFSKKIKKN